MTTQAIEKEEDLIIIWDESSTDTSMIDFSFPKSEVESIQPVWEADDFVIDFGETEKVDVKSDFALTENNDSEISFWDDLFWSNELLDKEPKSNLVIEEKTDSLDVDFWFSSPTVEDIKTEESIQILETEALTQETTQLFEIKNEEVKSEIVMPVLDTTFDRNAILDEAIAKMQSRKSSIWQTKSQKQHNVDDLNEQIKNLKSQVADLEKEIKDLEKEDSALDLDISSIEKMKESVLEVSVDRQRKHNLSNIKK